MSISDNEIRLWSKQGAKASSRITSNSVKNVLKNHSLKKSIYNYELYLQGSYKNATNIKSSDVDIVVQLNKYKGKDINSTEGDINLWEDFRLHIKEILQNEYGKENIIDGNKSLKIDNKFSSTVDVVPCLRFEQEINGETIQGFNFWTSDKNTHITTFSKVHFKNGILKNKETKKNYKPIIRIFKNMKEELIKNNLISKEDISSYFIECILYNVPNELYRNNYVDSTHKIISYLTHTNIENFKHQHNIKMLIGPNPIHLEKHQAEKFIWGLQEYSNR